MLSYREKTLFRPTIMKVLPQAYFIKHYLGGFFMEEFFNEKQMEAINFFQENLEKWASDPKYKLKHIIIHGSNIAGVFDTFDAAINEAVVKFPQDDFIIQQVISEDDVVNFIYPAV